MKSYVCLTASFDTLRGGKSSYSRGARAEQVESLSAVAGSGKMLSISPVAALSWLRYTPIDSWSDTAVFERQTSCVAGIPLSGRTARPMTSVALQSYG